MDYALKKHCCTMLVSFVYTQNCSRQLTIHVGALALLTISVFWPNQLSSSDRLLSQRNRSHNQPRQNQCNVRTCAARMAYQWRTVTYYSTSGYCPPTQILFLDLVYLRYGQQRTNSAQSSTRTRMTPSKLVSSNHLWNPYSCIDSNIFRRLRQSLPTLTQHTDVYSAMLYGISSMTAFLRKSFIEGPERQHCLKLFAMEYLDLSETP